ncbi:hypothetical protein Q1J55_25600 [Pseudomonas syringae]|uniref:hypothetical protein n=1 Tax=Pseudomonas syringae TaxID=317 RepID=UPI00128F80CA|nr:hypothetical protein [Pseudomonas syringae]
MKLVNSILFVATTLSCALAFAQDGSERSMQAAQQFRLAQQEAREKNELRVESQRLVKGENKTEKQVSEKSEG